MRVMSITFTKTKFHLAIPDWVQLKMRNIILASWVPITTLKVEGSLGEQFHFFINLGFKIQNGNSDQKFKSQTRVIMSFKDIQDYMMIL